MRDRIQADGDTWRVTSGESDPRRAVRTVVFHCLSDTMRPYRVVEVPSEALREHDLESASEDELRTLFNRSHTMDYSHDASAQGTSHGYGDPPLE